MIQILKKAMDYKQFKRALLLLGLSLLCIVFALAALAEVAHAQPIVTPPTSQSSAASQQPGISININGADTKDDRVQSLEILFLMTMLALLPSILIMMTAFTRIVIVLSFVRNAIGLQQTPPNQVIIGLALFLTLFVMQPVLTEIKDVSYTPYVEGRITQSEAIKAAEMPIKSFMLKETGNKELSLFITLSGELPPEDITQISMLTAVPAFLISELKTAFTIGLLLYIPFIIIDMVVSSTLMSMGMIMLPPAMISMPFKIMLFVVVDGWGMIVKTLSMGYL